MALGASVVRNASIVKSSIVVAVTPVCASIIMFSGDGFLKFIDAISSGAATDSSFFSIYNLTLYVGVR